MEDYTTDGVLILFPKALLFADMGRQYLKIILSICDAIICLVPVENKTHRTGQTGVRENLDNS